MVDNNLTVRRATPAARDAFNVLQSDVGRPFTDFKPNIDISDLEGMLRDVIDTLQARERRTRDKKGTEYSLRIRPYRTADNKIDGAVLTLFDLTTKTGNDRNKKS
jgi:two-component system CheB/CheR fusion protein